LTSDAKQAQIIALFKRAIKSESRSDRDKTIKLIQSIVEIANKSKDFKDSFNAQDVDNILLTGLGFSKLHKASSDVVEKYVKDNLLTLRKYHFYYPIYYTYSYPDNFKIGYCVAKQFNSLPANVKKEFEDFWTREFKDNKGFFSNLDQYLDNRKHSLFLHVTTESRGYFRCIELAHNLVDRSLEVLRTIYRSDVIAQDYCVVSDNSDWLGMGGYSHGERDPNHRGAWYYLPGMNEEFNELNEILTHTKTQSKKIEVAEKLKNAMHLMAAATSARYNEVKYVLLCSALEAMTLKEQDYLGLRLSERIAFLTQKPSKRKKVFDEIYDIYTKRSRIIHQDQKKPMVITDDEIWLLEGIAYTVFWQLVYLKNKGYQFFDGDENSILDYLDKLKFAGQKPLLEPWRKPPKQQS